VRVVAAVNLAVRFACELAALAALAVWGAQVGDSVVVQVALAVAAPLIAATLWGLWVAPKAARRLPDPARAGVELVVFGAAVAGLFAAGHPTAAVILAVLSAISASLVRVWPEPAATVARGGSFNPVQRDQEGAGRESGERKGRPRP
jgi:Protein of unknown function (DUF2568)